MGVNFHCSSFVDGVHQPSQQMPVEVATSPQCLLGKDFEVLRKMCNVVKSSLLCL